MPSILIVDDYPSIRSAIRRWLETCSVLTVCGEAVDGQDAIEKARQLKPDLILLDISMPGMDGVHAAQMLKGLLPDVRIVAFTMYAESLENSVAAANAFDAVLAKPASVSRVVNCLRSVLASASDSKPSAAQFAARSILDSS